MMILKYRLEITDTQVVSMPLYAEIISAENQRGELCIWALADENATYHANRTIDVIGTGNPMQVANRKHIGTVVIEPFVWHVFERV